MILGIEGIDDSGKSYIADFLEEQFNFINLNRYYEEFNTTFYYDYENSNNLNHVALIFCLFDKKRSEIIRREKEKKNNIIVEKYGKTSNATFISLKSNFKQYHIKKHLPKMPNDIFCEMLERIKNQDDFNKETTNSSSDINTYNIYEEDYFNKTTFFIPPATLY